MLSARIGVQCIRGTMSSADQSDAAAAAAAAGLHWIHSAMKDGWLYAMWPYSRLIVGTENKTDGN